MASCTSCKKRTTSFCFVHKSAVCDDCIVQPKDAELFRCAPNDVIRNYFDWLADGDYQWPPLCTLCDKEVPADKGVAIRLVCKCLFHQRCLQDAFTKRRSDIPLTDNRVNRRSPQTAHTRAYHTAHSDPLCPRVCCSGAEMSVVQCGGVRSHHAGAE